MINKDQTCDGVFVEDGAPAAEQKMPLEKGTADASGGDSRYDRILSAGYQLLDECGLDGLTVRGVLQATGLNRRSFYEHFADKDQLLLTIFAESIRYLAAQCRTRIEIYSDPFERLHCIIDYIVIGDAKRAEERGSANRRRAALCREQMRLADARPEDLKSCLSPLIDLLSEQMTAGMAMSAIRQDDPEKLAHLVYNLVSTTVLGAILAQEVNQQASSEPHELASRIWEFCRRGIAP